MSPQSPAELLCSNAALQWLGDHERLLPRLMSCLAPGGALAIQMPADPDATAHRRMRELAASPAWQPYFPQLPREWFVHEPASYYDWLSPVASHVDLWTIEYHHVLPTASAIVDWYRGTGLRPFLDALGDTPTRDRFAADYQKAINPDFPPRLDGRVLFPFKRLFVIAYR